MLRFYDTASGKIRAFRPLRKGEVRIYSCGPSVYAAPHLGNFRTYVFEDVVKRALMSEGFRVLHVMNITDVEDKAVRAAEGSMKRLRAMCMANEREFMRTSRKLNIVPADRYPRATANIPYMVKMIKKLLVKRLAYRDKRGDIFMDVSRVPGYGKFSRSEFRMGLGRRVMKDDYYQREAGDFLLWKAWKKSDGNIFWMTALGMQPAPMRGQSPRRAKRALGKGRPGWHIECSAMSARFLGVPFDIHEGGIDNVFSHHENEIAQTRGASGKKPAKYWLHVRHLLVEGKKMSKSLGNYYTVGEIRSMGYDYASIRAHLLGTHYRKRLDFTFRGLREAAADLGKCKACLAALCRCESGMENPEAGRLAAKTLASFRAHVSDDFNIPDAMDDFCLYVRKVDKLIRKRKFGKKNAEKARETIMAMGAVLGVLP